MNIAILYNKPSARFSTDATHKAAEEDTEESAKEILHALTRKGAVASLVPVTENTILETVNDINADLVFNLIEWTGVDTEYAMQTFDALNKSGLHYTGATKENYRDTCDKIITKKFCKKYGLPTADWQEFTTGDETIRLTQFPVLVKVSSEHSSVGISKDSIAQNAEDLVCVVRDRIGRYHQRVFAETFLPGREFQVTLVQKNAGLVILPPAEIVYTKGTAVPLLTYESRWNSDHADYMNSTVRLAALEKGPEKILNSLCRSAFWKFGFRDYARFDIRCDEKEYPYFLELNSNPGLGDDPEYGMTVSYKAAGMKFADFIWEIVESATRRTTE